MKRDDIKELEEKLTAKQKDIDRLLKWIGKNGYYHSDYKTKASELRIACVKRDNLQQRVSSLKNSKKTKRMAMVATIAMPILNAYYL